MRSADLQQLRRRFGRLAARVGLCPGEFDRLHGCYSEPHRHYHGWAHVEECLEQLDDVGDLLDDALSVEAAIWYHDAVWLAGSRSNELLSAEMAYRALRPADESRAAKVRAFILETDYSRPGRIVDRDLDYLKDIDFAAFGKPYPEFWDDVQRLRRERAPGSGDVRDSNTLRFYEAILEGGIVLFRTPHFAQRLQQQAMDNVRHALDALRGAGHASP